METEEDEIKSTWNSAEGLQESLNSVYGPGTKFSFVAISVETSSITKNFEHCPLMNAKIHQSFGVGFYNRFSTDFTPKVTEQLNLRE